MAASAGASVTTLDAVLDLLRLPVVVNGDYTPAVLAAVGLTVFTTLPIWLGVLVMRTKAP